MSRYILGRLSQAVLTLWILSLAIFLSVRLTGDPASYLLGPEGTRADYEQLKRNLGLDRPLPVQYGSYIVDLLQGNLGQSFISGRPARDLLMERLPATLQLAAGAFVIVVLIGIPLGVLSAVKRGTPLDVLAKLFAVVGIAAPNFWVATLCIFLFGAVLGWLPTYGQGTPDHLILPAFIVAWPGMAGMTRLARSSMLEVFDSEYVKFARVKGLSETLVIYKHALKNAVIPLITFAGLLLAGLLNGSVVVEVIFAWPGIGRLMLEGINQRDFAVVQAVVLAAGLFYIVTSLLVDILYAYVNPKIRYGV